MMTMTSATKVEDVEDNVIETPLWKKIHGEAVLKGELTYTDPETG